ncbi:Protein FAR1-RELATED SEQUENCE 5, partial [Striga hermonthica]
YNMVFAPFTGIDNHGKCVTFAAALIAKEDVDSYVWVLENFKSAMVDEPNYIITDQDPSIGIAFPKVFAVSKHRFLMCHIMNKLGEKVGYALNSDPNFKKRLNEIVWNRNIDPV